MNMDIREIVKLLNFNEKQELLKLLSNEVNTPNLLKLNEQVRTNAKIICPHCSSTEIYGHGIYRERKRYQCNSCKKTFNDYTGTAISGIQKVSEFQEYITLVVESMTLLKASKKLNINVKTALDWRHKLLSSLEYLNGGTFSGIVECDDKLFNINEKGSRKLDREPYKRSSDREGKRGVSNDKISVMVATDRKGTKAMQVAKRGRINSKSVESSIGQFVTNENVLCSDSHPSIILWAKERELEHHTFVASKAHIKTKCYHVQHVNSIDNQFERWAKRFNGFSTKYLKKYLNWFVFLEKVKKSKTQAQDFAKEVLTAFTAIQLFRNTQNWYENLIYPQCS